MMRQYCVIFERPTGHYVVGPFQNLEYAKKYVREHIVSRVSYRIVPIYTHSEED